MVLERHPMKWYIRLTAFLVIRSRSTAWRSAWGLFIVTVLLSGGGDLSGPRKDMSPPSTVAVVVTPLADIPGE